VLPLEQWLQERWREAVNRGQLPARRLLERGPVLRVWRQLIDSDDAFSLLGPGRAAELCRDARSVLSRYRIDPFEARHAQLFSFDDDSRAFLRWLGEFNRRLEHLDALCDEDAESALLKVPGLLQRQRVVVLDGVALAPLHDELLGHCADALHHASGTTTEQTGTLQSFVDERSELRAVARWCREQHEAGGGRRVAVVLGDMGETRERLEACLRREFECLTARYEALPVNFATGLALDRVPLVRDALLLLRAAADPVAVGDVAQLLVSPFLPLGALRAPLGEALATLAEETGDSAPQHLLARAVGSVFSQDALNPVEQVARLRRTGRWLQRQRLPSAWIDPFRAVLEAWQWPQGRALDSLEHQQFEHWQDALDGLAAFDAVTGELGFEAALDLLREQCAAALFQPRTEDAAIQVLGPLEVAGLSFDALWLAGMSADRWPPAPRPNPYLPWALQREHRLPRCDPAWEQDRARARLAQWQRSAGELLASYTAISDEARVSPSPLLSDWPACSSGTPAPSDPRWLAQASLAPQGVALSAVPVAPWESVAEGTGSHALQQQVRCPFQAFAAQRLAAHPPVEAGNGLTAAERGSLLHEALGHLFAALPDSQQLQASSDRQFGDSVDAAANAAIERLSTVRRAVLPVSALELERRRLRRLLVDWVALERTRLEPFTVIDRETPRELRLGTLTLSLRVDRIDLLRSGERLLIDYKGGAEESPRQWFDDPPRRPQLPLYALSDPAADAVAYAIVRSDKCAFKGVGSAPGVEGVTGNLAKSSGRENIADMTAAREYWQATLTQLAERFMAGENAVDPSPEACRYCARQSLCRVWEQGE
jgi:ATP-dependent helicase/nuclease subunit B